MKNLLISDLFNVARDMSICANFHQLNDGVRQSWYCSVLCFTAGSSQLRLIALS